MPRPSRPLNGGRRTWNDSDHREPSEEYGWRRAPDERSGETRCLIGPLPSYKSQQCSVASCQDVQPPTGRRAQFCVHSLHNDVHRGEERVHWWRQVEGGIPTRSSPGIAWRRSPAATSENGRLGAVEGGSSHGRGATEGHGATGRPRSSRCSRVAARGNARRCRCGRPHHSEVHQRPPRRVGRPWLGDRRRGASTDGRPPRPSGRRTCHPDRQITQ